MEIGGNDWGKLAATTTNNNNNQKHQKTITIILEIPEMNQPEFRARPKAETKGGVRGQGGAGDLPPPRDY